ncbi:MAG: HDOD domain-containing protein [Dehalococcoidia bacterium]
MTLPLPPELPLLPAPRERALLVLMNPDASMEAYLSVIEGDPALTAAVLRAANSAMSWPVRPIRDAAEGVVRLGTSAVRHLITATVVRSQFATIEAAGVDADEYWRHVLGCALLNEAQARDAVAGRQAFTVGLLHDIGRLAMAAQAPTRYLEVVNAAQNGASAQDAERLAFGITHEEFGQRICDRWRLPTEIGELVGSHHEIDLPDDEVPQGSDDPARQLVVARWIVRNMGIGDGVHRPERRRREAEEHPLLERLGGRADLMGNIRWFRDSTQGRQRPAA